MKLVEGQIVYIRVDRTPACLRNPSLNKSHFIILCFNRYYLFEITMSFHLTAESLRLEEKHILVAQLRNADGELVDSSIDLNTIIGNVDGMLPLPLPTSTKELETNNGRPLGMGWSELQRERSRGPVRHRVRKRGSYSSGFAEKD